MSAEDDLRQLLRRSATDLGAPSIDPSSLVAASRRRTRRRRRLVGGGALVAVAALAAVVIPSVLDDGDTERLDVAGPPSTASDGSGWTQLPDPPLSPRTGASAAWTGTEVVVFGGWDFLCPPGADCAPDPSTQTFVDGAAYDPASDAWRPIAAAPAPITNAGAVSVGGDVYAVAPCGPGMNCVTDPLLLRYRPEVDQWDTYQGPPGEGTGFSLVAAGERLLAVNGSDESFDLARPDAAFDPATEAWTELPDDPLPQLYDRQLVSIGDDLLLFGKQLGTAQSPGPLLGARLDGATGTWQELPPAPGSGYQAWAIDGRVLLNPHFGAAMLGGVFDPASATWSALPAFPSAESWRGDMAGALGTDSAVFEYSSGWVLDVPSGRWIEIPAVDGRSTFPDTSVVAVGRRLFLFGGEVWSGSDGRLLGDAWLWSPPTADGEQPEAVVWTQPPPESTDVTGMAALVEGVVQYDATAGCYLLEGIDGVTYPVVWPAGTEAASGGEVELADGAVVAIGDTVSGGGGYLQVATLPFAIPSACLPPTGEVAVFNRNGPIEVTPGP
jgi:hypothetical protein